MGLVLRWGWVHGFGFIWSQVALDGSEPSAEQGDHRLARLPAAAFGSQHNRLGEKMGLSPQRGLGTGFSVLSVGLISFGSV
jgi:hypothetical protein